MLIQFNFKNFKSFKNETILDLSATKITEFNDRVVNIGKERVLPIATIYGANASGKSNVYDAFEYMSIYVLDSLNYGGDENEYERHRVTPFLFDDESANAESSFEIYFTLPDDSKEKIYNYGFCVDKEGVKEEWFNCKAKSAKEYKRIFYRDGEKYDMPGISKADKTNIETALERQVLIASLGAKLKVEKCKLVRDWFMANEMMDFADLPTSAALSRQLPYGFAENKKIQDKVVKFLGSFDKNIKGFVVEELPREGESKEKYYNIKTIHNKNGTKETVELPFALESAGTLKMFSLYQALTDVFEKGSVLFVDELNARLHPLLLRNIVIMFANPEVNKNHAQLIFTTHDTSQLSYLLLRRDEIWFTEKDDDGVSELYSLADFEGENGSKIRKDENYEKNYMVGKYGAIPNLKAIDVSEAK